MGTLGSWFFFTRMYTPPHISESARTVRRVISGTSFVFLALSSFIISSTCFWLEGAIIPEVFKSVHSDSVNFVRGAIKLSKTPVEIDRMIIGLLPNVSVVFG